MAKFSFKKYFYFIIVILLFPLIFTFTIRGTYSNFINFNSSINIKVSNAAPDIEISSLPEIDYDSLNDIWYNPKVEMLIITPNDTEYIDAVKPLMDWKNEKGVKTIILSNFSSYDGVDNAEKIRNMIISYYEKENIRWVLLAGDAQESLIPIRKTFNPDTKIYANSFAELGNQDYKPTDFYYADLTGDWDEDGDGNWGEAPQNNTNGRDEVSWIPEVYVGRLPASNANELEIMINKTLQYEVNPNIGDWMTRMLLAGGISNYAGPKDPDGEDEARLTEYIWKNYVLPEMNFTHLTRTYRFTPETPPLPNDEGPLTSFKYKFNEGYSTVFFAGHGASNKLADSVGSVYNINDKDSALNSLMPSLFYADACTTAPYDYNENSIGETLIKKDQSGAIGFIGGLRVTWYFTGDENLEMINRGNAKLFWKEFFQEKKFQQGRALYDSKVAYIKSSYFTREEEPSSLDYEYERKNILTYNLLGDPEVDIYTNKPKGAMNPFTDPIYEGQLISTTIKDISGRVVPYGRVHLRTDDGKYYTVYADKEGKINFRLPAQENETYNAIITGHNLIPSYFSFETKGDYIKPNILGITTTPRTPLLTKNVYLNIKTQDNYSGIESVFLLFSSDDFENHSFYEMSNNFSQNDNIFSFNLGRLKPGEFSYSIVTRDYANNTSSFYSESYKFTVGKHIVDYIFPISLVLVVGVVGISIVIVYKGLQKYSEIVRKINEKI